MKRWTSDHVNSIVRRNDEYTMVERSVSVSSYYSLLWYRILHRDTDMHLLEAVTLQLHHKGSSP
jgi:hypothetical protein